MQTPQNIWIAACAHQLHRRWRTVDPERLEEVAADLWRDELLRAMLPADAALSWLEPGRDFRAAALTSGVRKAVRRQQVVVGDWFSHCYFLVPSVGAVRGT